MLYYWSKQYSTQLQESQPYSQLKRCVTINIINFALLPNALYHNVFHLREDHTGIPLLDDIEIHFLELPKLDEQAVSLERGGLVNWLLFLKGVDQTKWEKTPIVLGSVFRIHLTLWPHHAHCTIPMKLRS